MVIFISGQLANIFWIWPGNDAMRKDREKVKSWILLLDMETSQMWNAL